MWWLVDRYPRVSEQVREHREAYIEDTFASEIWSESASRLVVVQLRINSAEEEMWLSDK